jgi:hypothetical protein
LTDFLPLSRYSGAQNIRSFNKNSILDAQTIYFEQKEKSLIFLLRISYQPGFSIFDIHDRIEHSQLLSKIESNRNCSRPPILFYCIFKLNITTDFALISCGIEYQLRTTLWHVCFNVANGDFYVQGTFSAKWTKNHSMRHVEMSCPLYFLTHHVENYDGKMFFIPKLH